MKNKQGISLIVLVITIIVMTILAAAVVVTLNNTGIINKANEAVDGTNLKEVEQLAAVVWAEEFMDGKRGDTLKEAVLGKLADYTSKYDIEVTDKGVTVTKKENDNGVDEEVNNNVHEKYLAFRYNPTNKTAIVIGIKDEYNKDGGFSGWLTGEISETKYNVTYSGFTEGDTVTGLYSTAIIDENENIITDIVIPSNITGPDGETYTVTHIGWGAFGVDDLALWEWDIESKITSVTIPNSIISIEENAFLCCNKLVYNEYKNGMYLGNDTNKYLALVLARDVDSIEINANTRVIGGSAFYYSRKLINLTIPDSVIRIGRNAFRYCYDLNDVYYTGSESDWSKITIEEKNDYLLDATKHYNHVIN